MLTLDWVILAAEIIFLYWLLFMEGAEQLEGSWLTALLYVPGMTAAEIRVWGTLAVMVMIIFAFL